MSGHGAKAWYQTKKNCGECGREYGQYDYRPFPLPPFFPPPQVRGALWWHNCATIHVKDHTTQCRCCAFASSPSLFFFLSVFLFLFRFYSQLWNAREAGRGYRRLHATRDACGTTFLLALLSMSSFFFRSPSPVYSLRLFPFDVRWEVYRSQCPSLVHYIAHLDFLPLFPNFFSVSLPFRKKWFTYAALGFEGNTHVGTSEELRCRSAYKRSVFFIFSS